MKTFFVFISIIFSVHSYADSRLIHGGRSKIITNQTSYQYQARGSELDGYSNDISAFDVIELTGDEAEKYSGHCGFYKREVESVDQFDVNNYTNYWGDAAVINDRNTIVVSTHEIVVRRINGEKQYGVTKQNEIVAIQCGDGKKVLAKVKKYAQEINRPIENSEELDEIRDIAVLQPLEQLSPQVNPIKKVSRVSKITTLHKLDQKGFVIQGHCIFSGKTREYQGNTLCRNNAICHLDKSYYELKRENFDNFVKHGTVDLVCNGLNGVDKLKVISGSPVLVNSQSSTDNELNPIPESIGIAVGTTHPDAFIITVQVFPSDLIPDL